MLWDGDSSSEQKRLITKSFLTGRDEAWKQKTQDREDAKFIVRTYRRYEPKPVLDCVYLSKKEASRVRCKKVEYDWLNNNGYDATLHGWKKRMAGKPLPASIFGIYALKRY